MVDEHKDASSQGSREGVTSAERYLAKLCKRSFLSLWSYSCVFRDQGQTNANGDGKELCDLLVVFDNHIIIFSDKDCEFKDGNDIELGWSRWYRKAVAKSADQVFGAERWIKGFPDRIFLDRECKVPFPIDIPRPPKAIFHRIVVAHDGARKCRESLGGSGSLMLDSELIGDEHLKRPFTVGRVSDKGFVHVFDDTTLNVVMRQLDTISDFVDYLVKKEALFSGKLEVFAAGEEELLGRYVARLNDKGEHDFLIPAKYSAAYFDEGHWLRFLRSKERQAQIQANEISYAWDALIDKFAFHAISGTQPVPGGPLREQERGMRLIARENRTRRRLLSEAIHGVIARSVQSESAFDARVIFPSRQGDPYYVFVCARRYESMSYEEYRDARRILLENYCLTVKYKNPEAQKVIGIATESGLDEDRSEDMLCYEASSWTSDDEAYIKELLTRMPLLNNVRMTRGVAQEYPVDHRGVNREKIQSRNAKCKCGSGMKFRKCCGKKFYPSKIKK